MGLFGGSSFISKAVNTGLSMVPGVGSYMAAGETNEANSAQAQRQMDFQEDMSNTAHQRQVKDLKAAGLNPILSTHGSGSSTPQGASANIIPEDLSGVGTTALDIRRLKKELDATDSQVKLNTAAEATQKTQQTLNEASAKAAQANALKTETDAIKSATESNILNDQRGAIKAKAKADEARSKLEAEHVGKSFLLDKVEQATRAAGRFIPGAKINIGGNADSESSSYNYGTGKFNKK